MGNNASIHEGDDEGKGLIERVIGPAEAGAGELCTLLGASYR
jgi:hypothetical protein